MNKLKLYLRTKGDIKEQANEYAKVFNGKILKNMFTPGTEEWNYAYLNIVNDINFMIAFHREGMPPRGYNSDYILTLEKREEFDAILKNMQDSPNFTSDWGPTTYDFGGPILMAKFIDKWGYGWVIEIRK